MKNLLVILSIITALFCPVSAPAEEHLRVVATIKPLQLLAVAVGGDSVNVDVLLKPNISPHDYQLRPSDRRMLDGADVVLWIGPRLEVFLQSLVESLPPRTQVVALQDAGDPHLWLDPIAMGDAAQRLALRLAELRPTLATQFHRNADRVQRRLIEESKLMQEQLQTAGPLRNFIVEHDAYQRLEQRYGLHHLAALTDSSELPPSPAQLVHIQRLLEAKAIGCVWRERQQTRAMSKLLSGIQVNVEIIDALAMDQPISEEGFVQFYRRLELAMVGCLRAEQGANKKR